MCLQVNIMIFSDEHRLKTNSPPTSAEVSAGKVGVSVCILYICIYKIYIHVFHLPKQIPCALDIKICV